MEIKDILKDRRIELNLTQLDVAKAVGVSEATISRWESGQIDNMKRNRIAALAKVLRISPNVIMEWKEEDDFKSFGSLLDTQDEDLIDFIKIVLNSTSEDRELLYDVNNLSDEQKSKLKKLIKSNIL